MFRPSEIKNASMRKIKKIHFIGIGGTGMNGIAEVLLNQGYQISGSDINENSTIKRLIAQGAKITLGHTAKNIAEADVIVTSTAVKENNPEVIAARAVNIPIIPRAQMLAELMRFCYGIAIAGTHGKTTTTSLVASILAEAGLDPTYVIGGRLNSTEANAKLGKSTYFVAEADESDASFLYLQPMMAIVTNIDIDHMETYGDDIHRLQQTFIEFLHHLPFYGLAIMCIDDLGVQKILTKVTRPIVSYGFSELADVRAVDVRQSGLKTHFVVQRKQKDDLELCINLPGKHNVENALAAITVATELAIDDAAILEALRKFAGVGRRCEVLGEFNTSKGKVILIDDYGHHPREVAVTQQAIKAAYPQQRLITIFQPHRYTRTKSLFEDFVHVLADTEVLLMLDVYAAGEASIPGADSRSLCRSIRRRGKVEPIFIAADDKLLEVLQPILQDGDVILMQGAGNIGTLAHNIAANLAES